MGGLLEDREGGGGLSERLRERARCCYDRRYFTMHAHTYKDARSRARPFDQKSVASKYNRDVMIQRIIMVRLF